VWNVHKEGCRSEALILSQETDQVVQRHEAVQQGSFGVFLFEERIGISDARVFAQIDIDLGSPRVSGYFIFMASSVVFRLPSFCLVHGSPVFGFELAVGPTVLISQAMTLGPKPYEWWPSESSHAVPGAPYLVHPTRHSTAPQFR
jgi:hypothetical protein